MICLGSPQRSPTYLESEAAQLYAVKLFRDDFLSRYPGGIVISEYEYMGRTTSAPNDPSPIQFRGKPRLNQILEALSSDFRRWIKNRDYRKCDALAIDGYGTYAELLEVTTVTNAASAMTQIVSKLAILRETVNRIFNASVDWRLATWRPNPAQLFYLLPSSPEEINYLCYQPTSSALMPGVILYEVHVLKKPAKEERVQVPSELGEPIRKAVLENRPQPGMEESWARQFINEHPNIASGLRALAVLVGIAAAVAAIVLIFDPVPGDEVAMGAVAMALFKFSMAG
jgi:hypothetical protein